VNYLDANFATAFHIHIERQSDLVKKFTRKNSEPFLFSELAELECRRAFVIRTGETNSENWMHLQAFLAEGVWRHEPVEWKALLAEASRLVDRFGMKLKAGTLDTLHVAHALHTRCTRFLSFDTNSNARVLAASCRLKVFPELTSKERASVLRNL
jgi:hypothetical protein